MMADLEDLRHRSERGQILKALKEDYARAMTSMANLLGVLDAIAIHLDFEGLTFHLKYLAEQGYVQAWHAKDLPGYRRDRRSQGKPDDIRFVRLSAKGLQLLDGRIAEDPMVDF